MTRADAADRKPSRHHLLSTADPSLRRQLSAIADVATQQEQPIWIVGGLVRDLLLGRKSKDIDLVLLRKVAEFADTLAKLCGGKVHRHERFLTADFTADGGYEIDLVRARSELYESPAALPRVRSGTLIEDLFRRDFTVNSMALPLNGADDALLDPFDGHSDLIDGRLRVLHEQSFIEDPTRLLRGLRLGHRLDLDLEPQTAQLAKRAVAEGVFDRLSGVRLRSELQQLLSNPATVLNLLPAFSELGLEKILHPQLSLSESVLTRLEHLVTNADTEIDDRWMMVLGALTWDLDRSQRAQVADRLSLAAGDRHLLLEVVSLAQSLPRRLETLDSVGERFHLGVALGPVGRMLASCSAKPAVVTFLEAEWPALHSRRPLISGSDLIRLGFASDRSIGRALEETLRARLEGRIGRTEELLYAARWLRRTLATDDEDDLDGGSCDDPLGSGNNGTAGN